jgi:hypothetical protein
MSDEAVIKKIVDALEDKLAEMVIADHLDALNAVTEVMINILKTAEYLSPSQAYTRASEVFADAAVAEEAEAAEEAAKAKAKAEAAAKAKQPHVRRVLKIGKIEQYELRQQRVAARAAKQAREQKRKA